MHTMLLWLVVSIVPHETALVDTVDVVEINHFYGEDGKHVFDQIIFYRW